MHYDVSCCVKILDNADTTANIEYDAACPIPTSKQRLATGDDNVQVNSLGGSEV